jgi:PhnB protein
VEETIAMQLNTYIHFSGNCEEALKFYEEHLGGKILITSRYGSMPGNQCPDNQKDLIMHARIQIGDTLLMASDAPPDRFGPIQGVTISISVESNEEAERIYAILSEGGRITMPMGEQFFAHRFGMFTDKFGLAWMIVHEKRMG